MNPTLNWVGAQTPLRELRETLGEQDFETLHAIAVLDESWERLSWRLRCSDKAAEARTAKAPARRAGRHVWLADACVRSPLSVAGA